VKDSKEKHEDFIIFGAPKIERVKINEVVKVMESGWLGTGPRVAQFENDFAAHKGSTNAVAVNSCTAALH
jgi:dTDP-4-amino-4,6-dideoxygalactose transaminase